MARARKCIAIALAALAVCLVGCSDAALQQKARDLEKENAELKKKLEDKAQPSAAIDTRLPTEEALACLEGKPFPLPGNVNGGGKAGKESVIQRRGVQQLTWEGSSVSLEESKEKTHHYALLYDAEGAHFLAEVHITIRQVGEKRVCVGVQIMGVRKIEKTIDTKPK